jgi:hypothetical protein
MRTFSLSWVWLATLAVMSLLGRPSSAEAG